MNAGPGEVRTNFVYRCSNCGSEVATKLVDLDERPDEEKIERGERPVRPYSVLLMYPDPTELKTYLAWVWADGPRDAWKEALRTVVKDEPDYSEEEFAVLLVTLGHVTDLKTEVQALPHRTYSYEEGQT